MENKKGAEMTIGTIVMIILALVVLVVIIYGFTTGWGNLWENIVGFGGGNVNVQTHVTSCELACSTNGVFDYCTKERQIRFTEDGDKEPRTCQDLIGTEYGLEECMNIDCFGSASTNGAELDVGAIDDGANSDELKVSTG